MRRSMLGRRGAVNGADAPVVAVTSDRSLVADAVSAALSGAGLAIVRIPWPGDPDDHDAGWARGDVPPQLALLLCDLDPSSVDAARRVVDTYPVRWLLLTDAPRGPLWGAMIEAGVAGILSSSTTMAEVQEAIIALHEGSLDQGLADRVELVEAWHRSQSEAAEARAKMRSLTPREREVLRMSHLGHTVHEIAEINGVAPSTVRSQVRSVLRKLGVNSQLAASAIYEKWGRD